MSRTYVFQGKVEFRLVSDGRAARNHRSSAILLAANESARIQRQTDGTVSVIRGAGQLLASHFARKMLRQSAAKRSPNVPMYRVVDLG